MTKSTQNQLTGMAEDLSEDTVTIIELSDDESDLVGGGPQVDNTGDN